MRSLFHLGVICEGDGEEAALPDLLRRVGASHHLGFTVGRPRNAHGRANLTKSGGVERFFSYTAPEHDAVLILLDADEDCPVDLARELARRVRVLQPSVPAALVAANAAFESWFLADLGSIVGERIKGRVLIPTGDPPEDPDGINNPKSRFTRLLARRTTYKETTDQPALAARIDLEVVNRRSRSFRRLLGALRDLEAAVAAGSSGVTPD